MTEHSINAWALAIGGAWLAYCSLEGIARAVRRQRPATLLASLVLLTLALLCAGGAQHEAESHRLEKARIARAD